MKRLILLLIAIYSLMFYQRNKIVRSKDVLPPAKEVSKMERSYQQPGLIDLAGQENANLSARDHYPIYRYTNPGYLR